MRNAFLLITIFYFQLSYSQDWGTLIKGFIHSESLPVENIHIVNLSSKIGVISNEKGTFQIHVRINDSIQISSIQFQKKHVIINNNHIKGKRLNIYLNTKIYSLDTVIVKTHNLIGILLSDLKKTPKKKTPKMNFEMPKVLHWKTFINKDHMDLIKPPSVLHLVDPTYTSRSIELFGGGGGGGSVDRKYEQEKKMKKLIQQNKDFPTKIKSDLGLDFFIKVLLLDENEINHFLDFCNSRDIINLYYKNKLLEVIEILIKESKYYKKN